MRRIQPAMFSGNVTMYAPPPRSVTERGLSVRITSAPGQFSAMSAPFGPGTSTARTTRPSRSGIDGSRPPITSPSRMQS